MKTKKEIIRFLIAGTVVNATDFSVYFFLFRFFSVSISKGVSFTCAGIVGYLLNKYWTFKSIQSSCAEVGRYTVISALALGINVLANQGILNVWSEAVWPAFVIATTLTSLFIFMCFKWWVFKIKRGTKDLSKERLTLRARFLNLWRSNISPHEIALGMAIGVFIGITPLYGFHMIMAFISAFTIKHVNKVAIFLGVNISLPPTIPFITWAGYSIGQKMLVSAYPPLSWDAFRNFSQKDFFHFFYVLLVGSFVLGIVVSVFFYFLTLLILKLKRKMARIIVAKRKRIVICGGNGSHGDFL